MSRFFDNGYNRNIEPDCQFRFISLFAFVDLEIGAIQEEAWVKGITLPIRNW